MTLKLGDPAPKFSLPSGRGEVVDVGACFGDTPVVLLFFPFAYTPVCTAEFCQFRDEWQQWGSLGCKVFGISIDSMFVTEKFRADLSIPFPLLSDFNKTVSAAATTAGCGTCMDAALKRPARSLIATSRIA